MCTTFLNRQSFLLLLVSKGQGFLKTFQHACGITPGSLGTGQAHVGNAGFHFMLTDDLMLGMQGVYKQMVEAFRSLGVEAVPGPGNIFDPEVHEAIMREENDDLPDGTVLQEFRRGFRLGNQLLRAAMVQVRLFALH